MTSSVGYFCNLWRINPEKAAQRTANLYTAIIQSNNSEISDMDKMMDALYNISQWEVFLRILYNELIKSSKQIETLNNKLADNYQQIQTGKVTFLSGNFV